MIFLKDTNLLNMKTLLKIKKHSVGFSESKIDLRKHSEEIEDFFSGLNAKEILEKGEFVLWEKAKKKLDKKHRVKE